MLSFLFSNLMNARLCPSCSSLIESESAFFCYSCGQELEAHASHEKEISPPPINLFREKQSNKKGFSPFILFLSALILVWLVSLSFYLARRDSLKGIPSPLSAEVKKDANELVSTAAALPIAPYDLTGSDLRDLIPAEARLLIQSRLPSLIIKGLLSEKQKDEFVKKTGLTVGEVLSFLDEDYLFARMDDGFLALFKVKDVDFVKKKIDEFSGEELLGEVFGNVLALSDSESVLKKTNAVFGKRALSLSQSSDFAEGLRRLPEFGQVLIYSQERDLIRHGLSLLFGDSILDQSLDSLSGSLFVISVVSGNAKITGVYGR